MELWWRQLETYTKRDQLSLPYVLHKSRLRTKIWDWNFRDPRTRISCRYIHRRGLASDIYIFLKQQAAFQRRLPRPDQRRLFSLLRHAQADARAFSAKVGPVSRLENALTL